MTNEDGTPAPRIVTREVWLDERRRLLAKEKELTRLRDQLSAARRALPWVRVERPYSFETREGPRTLRELFGDKSQLIVYHFMFGPDSPSACKSCSFWADGFNGVEPHLAARDAAFVAISRAPLDRLQQFARRLGWSFPWVSSAECSFNFDFGVSFARSEIESGEVTYNYGRHKAYGSEMPGISVFASDGEGNVFHTYSCFARGLDLLNATYNWLDLTPKGRDEANLPYPMAWVRLRDEYGSPRA